MPTSASQGCVRKRTAGAGRDESDHPASSRDGGPIASPLFPRNRQRTGRAALTLISPPWDECEAGSRMAASSLASQMF